MGGGRAGQACVAGIGPGASALKSSVLYPTFSRFGNTKKMRLDYAIQFLQLLSGSDPWS